MSSNPVTNYSKVKFSTYAAFTVAQAVAKRYSAFKKGAMAAKSLAKQRKLLASMHDRIEAGMPAQAQVYYAAWKKERAQYLVLVGFFTA